MKKLLFRLIFPILFLCQFAAAQQGIRTVFFVRNAEPGTTADVPLSPAGLQRAQCLAQTLKDAGIKQIFTNETKLTQQTAEPLAKLQKITPSSVPARDTSVLIRDIAYVSGNALVVGNTETLSMVIARMHGGNIAAVGPNDFDRLYVMTVTDAMGTPVATLHYCGGSAPAGAAQTPKPATTGTKKAPAKKP